MKRAISLLLVIVMTTIALAGCDSKSENPAGNANSKQPTDESITIKNSPDKYTWYIKNYVGKNCASIGYTSMGGDRMDTTEQAILSWLWSHRMEHILTLKQMIT